MPEHNSSAYIKFNSHLSCVQDLEKEVFKSNTVNSDNDSNNDDLQFTRLIIPIALILYSEDEAKFKYHQNLRESCPKNTLPKYLLVHLYETDEDHNYLSFSRFALLKLGTFGIVLDEEKVKILQIEMSGSGVYREERLVCDGKPVISIQKISETEIEFYFSQSVSFWNLKVELCQENIENTLIRCGISGYSSRFQFNFIRNKIGYESTCISPQIIRNGEWENIASCATYDGFNWVKSIALFKYNEKKKKANILLTFGATIKNTSITMVNQTTNDIYEMRYGNDLGFYRIITGAEPSLEHSIPGISELTI